MELGGVVMSGPATSTDDQPAMADGAHSEAPCVEVTDSRESRVGRLQVRRALPRRGRRTVGAWCFVDHMGPADVTEDSGLDLGPHPHIGLQTVTWLVDGQVLHRDSLGSEQVIRPGELNLMTAGNAVAHSEEATGHYRGVLHGLQLWVALPEHSRRGPAAFEHHVALPQGDIEGVESTVFLGEYEDLVSPARHDTPIVGVDLALRRSAVLPLRPEFEYAILVLDGVIDVHGKQLHPGRLGYFGRGRDELTVEIQGPARAVLLGGEPFEEPLMMWWNFVARTRAELDDAYESWARQDDRFGTVHSTLPTIPSGPPPWRRGGEPR